MARIADFVAGQRVGATTMNAMLAGVVHVFDDASARDAAFPVADRFDGLMTLVLNNHRMHVWNNSNWQRVT